jgi:hypothetical protein
LKSASLAKRAANGAVLSLTQSEEGHDLAPESCILEPGVDFSQCSTKDTCEDYLREQSGEQQEQFRSSAPIQ